MTPEEIRIAMAETEGYTKIHMSRGRPFSDDDEGQSRYNDWCGGTPDCKSYIDKIPQYDSLDDIQRVFKGLTLAQRQSAAWSAARMLVEQGNSIPCSEFEATPAQWCEAILRAIGRWRE